MKNLNLLIAAAVIAVFVCGCGENSGEIKAPVNPITERMSDKEYVAKLDEFVAERRELVSKADKIRKQLAKAKAADPSGIGDDVKRLTADLKAAAAEIDLNLKRSQATVAAKLRQQKKQKGE